jgi:pyruvate dehydrogenase E2 component (dihydrolipoamide acetyltransferase)
MPEPLVIPMPHMGVSVTEGTVVAWHKAVGDSVKEGEAICDVETDKVEAEIPSPADGVLSRVLADVGDTVQVGEPLAELEEPGFEPPVQRLWSSAPAEGRFEPTAAAVAVISRPGKRSPISSPVARRIAEQHGIDLTGVEGTGMRGRVRKADVLALVETDPTPQTPHPTPDLPRGYEGVPHEAVPHTRQRKLIAEHMVRSRRTAAHMTTEADVDMSAASRARKETGASYLALIAHATCAALREFPSLNATFQEERLLQWGEVNMGIAVDTEVGLLVPVIRRCDRLDARGITDAIADLAQRARSRGLTADDMRAGTFTISNPGSLGGVSGMAIINQPQVAILGTPAIVRRPWVVTDEHGDETIGIRPIMRLALTYDHRAVDGAEATRCVVRIKQLLEG